ncbi:MAG: DPP IV N-terminal domain-containing protein [Pirellulales bacterium]
MLLRRIVFRYSFCFAVSLLPFAQPGPAAADTQPAAITVPATTGNLTLDDLFASDRFDTESVPDLTWSSRSSTYFVWQPSSQGTGQDLVRHDPATGSQETLVPAAAMIPRDATQPLDVAAFEFSADESRLLIFTNTRRVWRRNTRGDYWVLNVATGQLQKLGGDSPPSTLMFAKFSPDGTRVAFVRDNNLYVQDLTSLIITPLTTDGSESLINGTSDWVNEEELDLRDCYRWSPDGKQLLFWQFDTTGVSKFHLINNTDSQTPQLVTFAYPKVGQQNSATRLGIVAADGQSRRWINLPGDPREHYLPHAEWTPDGTRILVQQFNRLQNQLKVWLADPTTGDVRPVMTETDDAWLESENPVRWLDDGRSFLWLSERSGWRHAYRVPLDGQSAAPITQGDFDVIDVVGIDQSDGWLVYSASPENATQQYSYRVRLDGSQNQRLSPADRPGWYGLELSPDGKWGVRTFSNFTTPPVVDLIRVSDQSVVRKLADNQQLRDRLATIQRPEIEFFQLQLGAEYSLDGWTLRPKNREASDKLPLLMYVYGEPHGQTVRDAWPGKIGLWHWMLANQGFVVASVDNRGANVPKGRSWRKSVHRKIGIVAPADQAQAVTELLKRWPFVDPSRVGSWGWSGGGSMSLHAIFRYPDIYRAAIAIAPVADQQLYDTIYQERYMGLPPENPSGYFDGSPINHAHGLQGQLLLIHGTGDDNCHYQGTERLVNELIAEGKQFTVLPYPNRTHAVSEGQNTERHLMSTMTQFLLNNLKDPTTRSPQPQASSSVNRPTLQIFNQTDNTAQVYRLNDGGERKWVGTVVPRQNVLVRASIGERFVVVDPKSYSEAQVTCEVPVQAFRFGPLPALYTQHASAEGFPVVASARVNPYALREAVYIINQMLAQRPDVRRAMIQSGAQLSILAHDEFTTDLPEWAGLINSPDAELQNLPAKDFWDARARGMGGSETDPYCSCAEENLLGFEGDPYSAECILIHELAHNIHLRGMTNVDPTFDGRLKAAYEAAMATGLWHGKYASVNHHEYFAEGVQSWFDDNREDDHDHNHVNTRVELIQYDPRLAELCREVFGETEFRYTKPTTRLTGHLEGYDPHRSPRFEFPPRLGEARKRIREAAQNRGSASK